MGCVPQLQRQELAGKQPESRQSDFGRHCLEHRLDGVAHLGDVVRYTDDVAVHPWALFQLHQCHVVGHVMLEGLVIHLVVDDVREDLPTAGQGAPLEGVGKAARTDMADRESNMAAGLARLHAESTFASRGPKGAVVVPERRQWLEVFGHFVLNLCAGCLHWRS